MSRINSRQRRRISGSILIFLGASSFVLAIYLLASGIRTGSPRIALLLVALPGLFLALVGMTFFRSIDENEKRFGAATQSIKRAFSRVTAWFRSSIHLNPK